MGRMTRGAMSPAEYEAVIATMRQDDTLTRLAARQVLVDGRRVSDVAREWGIKRSSLSLVVHNILNARERLMHALSLLLSEMKGETK